MEKIKLSMHETTSILLPDYFEKFSCKGGCCRNTCCQGWQIDISRAEYNKLRSQCDRHQSLPNSNEILERRPRKTATDKQYALIKYNSDGYCPLLSNGGLCNLQLTLGYPQLPKICKRFPRYLFQIDEKELVFTLDTGCECTLELLWEHCDQPMNFIRKRVPVSSLDKVISCSTGYISGYACDIRNLCMLIIQNRRYSLSDRLILLGLALRNLNEIDQNKSLDRIPNWFAQYLSFTKDCGVTDLLQSLTGDSRRFVYNNLRFYALQTNREKNNNLFSHIADVLQLDMDGDIYYFELEAYQQARKECEECFPSLDNFFEHFLCTIILRWNFPFFNDATIWNSYISLCFVYSLMLFTAIASRPQNTKELIDNLVILSRFSLNNNSFDSFSYKIPETTESNTLAHIAILLRG